MSETTLRVSMPLDSEGFLRRECPACERQFKWLPSDGGELAAVYFCPYCARPAKADAWWTKQQLDFAGAEAAARVLGPQLRAMGDSFNRGQQRNSFIKLSLDVKPPASPAPLTEPDDMVRVEFECHPDEPLKVEEDWSGSVACLACGRVGRGR